MKQKTYDAVLFATSMIALFITMILLWKFGAYEISYGDSAIVIEGGWFLISMNALRGMALCVLCVISGVRLFRTRKP